MCNELQYAYSGMGSQERNVERIRACLNLKQIRVLCKGKNLYSSALLRSAVMVDLVPSATLFSSRSLSSPHV